MPPSGMPGIAAAFSSGLSATTASVVRHSGEIGHGRLRTEQRHAAAGHDALFDRSLRRLHCVLDAVLLLLELDLGGRADLDDRNATRQLRKTLLELLAVVVGVGVVDLVADL